mgnify:CR=1 FL=1|tara:strand:+ start:400 stop:759 length:360 start_codon:yes stop_codon:yes gene_type:complete
MVKGLGDKIEKVTEWTGLKKLVKSVFGEDCGCEERKEKLNQMFPNFKNLRAFNEDEKELFESILPNIEKNNMITAEEKTSLSHIYKGVFKQAPQWSSCGSCNLKVIDNLKKVYAKSCIK